MDMSKFKGMEVVSKARHYDGSMNSDVRVGFGQGESNKNYGIINVDCDSYKIAFGLTNEKMATHMSFVCDFKRKRIYFVPDEKGFKANISVGAKKYDFTSVDLGKKFERMGLIRGEMIYTDFKFDNELECHYIELGD